jgi:nucleotide-binding universal stress UspA family protein
MDATRINQIVCPIDLSDISDHVVGHAAVLAQWYGARLTLLHVVANAPVMDLPPPVLDPAERLRLERAMRDVAAHAAPSVAMDSTVVEAESAPQAILEHLATSAADLVVMGSHGRSGFQRFFLGSVTEKVIRKAACPAMVVPPRAPDLHAGTAVGFRRILCAVDFSDSSLTALARALSVSGKIGGHLTLLHVIEIPPELREPAAATGLDVDRVRAAAEADALRRLRELIPDRSQLHGAVDTAVEQGKPYREVLRVAADRSADLIVMGVHGRSAVDLMIFGSTTHHVVRQALCPVLVVRQD